MENSQGLIEGVGQCRFCRQMKVLHTAEEWSQTELDEAATLTCGCADAKIYAFRKEALRKTQAGIDNLFSEGNRLQWLHKVQLDPELKPVMLKTVEAIGAGMIDKVQFTSGAVTITLAERGDGRISMKWNYKDKGDEEA